MYYSDVVNKNDVRMAKNVVSFLIHDPDVMMWMFEFSLGVCLIDHIV
jgi:hypothetical protein